MCLWQIFDYILLSSTNDEVVTQQARRYDDEEEDDGLDSGDFAVLILITCLVRFCTLYGVGVTLDVF